MRATFSSVAIMASSLLAREVLAAPHNHRRAYVTDIVMVTEEVIVTAAPDGSYVTQSPVPIGTTTIEGTPVFVSSTPSATSSSTPAPTSEPPVVKAPATSVVPASSSSSAAIFIQKPKPSSSSSSSSTPVPTLPAVVVVPTPPVVQAPTTLVASTSSASPAPSPAVNSGKKRGLAYNDAGLLSNFVTSSSLVSWAYNWASSTAKIPSGLEFVPILWGMEDRYTSVWKRDADAALASGSTHLMSFNEPDYSGQANLAYSAAVSGYLQYVQPYASKAKLGTPAVTNGGSPMGLAYLGQFISSLKSAGGTYDFCAIHWYDSATNIDYFKSYMQQAAKTCGDGKTLWITEFGATGSPDEQNTFLQTVMPWMDQQDFIERYAYFMVAPGNLISSGTTLSTLGNIFASFT